MRILFTLSLSLLFFLQTEAQVYLEIDVQQAVDTIAANIDNEIFTILDVRTQGEYDAGHIEGAFQRDFYADDFEMQMDSLDKSRTYLIYCQSGGRSGATLQLMEDLAFERVYDMLGGMGAWNAESYPVTTDIPDFVNLYPEVVSGVEDAFIDFTIHPNPTSSSVLIDTELAIEEIELYSAQGNVLKKFSALESKRLDLSRYPSGVYYLRMRVGEEVFMRQVVKL